MACGFGLIRLFVPPADSRMLFRKRMQWMKEQKRRCLADKQLFTVSARFEVECCAGQDLSRQGAALLCNRSRRKGPSGWVRSRPRTPSATAEQGASGDAFSGCLLNLEPQAEAPGNIEGGTRRFGHPPRGNICMVNSTPNPLPLTSDQRPLNCYSDKTVLIHTFPRSQPSSTPARCCQVRTKREKPRHSGQPT
jgi:hypothetical protein